MDAQQWNLHPSNFKFITFLNSSPFSDEERHNIYTIFSALRAERQLDILDHWSKYLEKLLAVKIHIETERQELVHQTFERIVHEIDDVYLRHQEEEEHILEESKQKQADMMAALQYDAERRQQKVLQVRQIEIEERQALYDPLSMMT